MISAMRVYSGHFPAKGKRFLVDRLWPRGVSHQSLPRTEWVKEVGPSNELRQWFAHDPSRWQQFRRRYFAELEARPDVWKPILDAARQGDVVLLFGARDEEHNNAVALKAFLESRLRAG